MQSLGWKRSRERRQDAKNPHKVIRPHVYVRPEGSDSAPF